MDFQQHLFSPSQHYNVFSAVESPYSASRPKIRKVPALGLKLRGSRVEAILHASSADFDGTICCGDFIVAVDGEPVDDENIWEKLRGEVGTDVELRVRRVTETVDDDDDEEDEEEEQGEENNNESDEREIRRNYYAADEEESVESSNANTNTDTVTDSNTNNDDESSYVPTNINVEEFTVTLRRRVWQQQLQVDAMLYRLKNAMDPESFEAAQPRLQTVCAMISNTWDVLRDDLHAQVEGWCGRYHSVQKELEEEVERREELSLLLSDSLVHIHNMEVERKQLNDWTEDKIERVRNQLDKQLELVEELRAEEVNDMREENENLKQILLEAEDVILQHEREVANWKDLLETAEAERDQLLEWTDQQLTFFLEENEELKKERIWMEEERSELQKRILDIQRSPKTPPMYSPLRTPPRTAEEAIAAAELAHEGAINYRKDLEKTAAMQDIIDKLVQQLDQSESELCRVRGERDALKSVVAVAAELSKKLQAEEDKNDQLSRKLRRALYLNELASTIKRDSVRASVFDACKSLCD